MIKRLRTKFIALAMISVLTVLCVLVGVINMLNYRDVLTESDNILEMLSDYGGSFPEFPGGMGKPGGFGREDFSQSDSRELESLFDDIKEKRDRRHVTEETPFEARYFSVTLDESGSASDIDLRRIASVDEDTAIEYAEQASEHAADGSAFFLDHYRCTIEQSNGTTRILFLDCSKSLGNFRSFLRISIEIAALAFAVVSLLIIYFSQRIIRPVAESYDKQKRFITDAGHEIKTPLSIISADATVLEMENGTSEWLDDIRLQTARLTELTNELVYLSRMEEVQKAGTHKMPFDLSTVVSEIAHSFDARARVMEKEYSYDIASGLTLSGDEEAIRKLTGILLDNAFKYSDAGGTIRLSLARKGRSYVLSVFNSAEMVCREDTAHFFERFYRADKSRNSETGGHGIGLSIAEAVVRAHGGKITASTQDEKSLLITAVLPEAGA